MDDRKHVTNPIYEPSQARSAANDNGTPSNGWSLSAQLGSLLLSVAFTRHSAALPQQQATRPDLSLRQDEYEYHVGDEVLWSRPDGHLVPATVTGTLATAHGELVSLHSRHHVHPSSVALDPARPMGERRRAVLAERLGDLPSLEQARSRRRARA